jgi:hypothetical protein
VFKDIHKRFEYEGEPVQVLELEIRC